MVKLKIRAIGTSAGVILPKNALEHLNAQEGDELFLVETKNGYEISAYDPEFEKQIELAEEGMSIYKNALRELAK